MPDEQGKNTGRGSNPEFIRNQWKPGQSGNPKGRRRGSSEIWQRVRTKLERSLPDGRQVADLVAEVIVREALKGNWRALKELLDREEGVVSKQPREPDQLSIAELLAMGDELESKGDASEPLRND